MKKKPSKFSPAFNRGRLDPILVHAHPRGEAGLEKLAGWPPPPGGVQAAKQSSNVVSKMGGISNATTKFDVSTHNIDRGGGGNNKETIHENTNIFHDIFFELVPHFHGPKIAISIIKIKSVMGSFEGGGFFRKK